MLIGGIAAGFLFLQEYDAAKSEVVNFHRMGQQVETPPSEVYSSDGKLLYRVLGQQREYVPLDQIPEMVQHAMVAAEDRRFYDHQGVDWLSIPRIILVDATKGRFAQGGSTITMQLSKIVSANYDRSLKRKLHDMALATALERELTKDEILELYLNKVYFGNQAYGIKEAADVYFGKPLDRLTIGEAALLVRLVRRPASWAHLTQGVNESQAIEDRNYVLGVMLDEGWINQSQYTNAVSEKPKFNRHVRHTTWETFGAPYFIDHVLSEFRRDFKDVDLSQGGYRIDTTLDSRIQAVAEDAVRTAIREHRDDSVTTGAFVLMNTEGQLLAEVGGVDYKRNPFDSAWKGERPPGSSFKAILYATAFDQGVLKTPNDLLSNERITFPSVNGSKEWTPKNDVPNYGGDMTVEDAFRWSVNVPAAHLIQQVGVSNVVREAQDVFGIQSPLRPYPSIALGSEDVTPLEMLQAYSIFALHGDRATPYVIKKVTGPNGEVIREYEPRIEHNKLSGAVCDQMQKLLRAVVVDGTGSAASDVPDAHGKTGTTSDNRDAWFCGYADGLIGVGWVANEVRLRSGHFAYRPMDRSVFGGTVTVPFWANIMEAAENEFGPNYGSVQTDAKIANRDDQVDRPKPAEKEAKKEPAPAMAPDVDDDMGNMADGPDDSATTKSADTAPPTTDATKDTDTTDNTDKQTPPPSDNSGGDGPTDTPSDTKTPEKIAYVTVEICAESGKLATRYCPETISKRFRKGTEPTESCPIHKG